MTEIQWQDVAPKRYRTDRHTIIGIDGEGWTDNKGVHRYNLLAASNDEFVEDASELTTAQCFDFLLSLPRAIKGTSYLFVGFSINYDVNMWLRDLPKKKMERLHEHGHVYWKHYNIKWKPNKTFSVADNRYHKRILVYDVFGFFQTSFVNALRTWKVGDAATVDAIAATKEARGTFTPEQREHIRAYCFDEVHLLVQLMHRLIEATRRAEIPCNQWYGVGALASGMMQKYGVKKFKEAPPESIADPVLRGYYGGRFEIAGTGFFENVHSYDINSAYPSVLQHVPCLKHVTYQETTTYDPDAIALWRVEWNVGDNHRWGPFPWRNYNKSIHYPVNGEGWYWYKEVAAARRMYGADAIRVTEGIVLTPQCGHTPFDFIPDVYNVRKEYKRNGDQAHMSLKLGINALYGKTAQSLGNKEKVPPYQSFIWAGLITSGCRAQILDALNGNEDAVVSIATDGIVSTRELPLNVGTALGTWEHTEHQRLFLVQPGIYCYRDDVNGTTVDVPKTRGFGSKETSFDAIEAAYRENPIGKYEYTATRFIGWAGAHARKEYEKYWRRWVTAKRSIRFTPSQRWIPLDTLTLLARGHKINPIWHNATRLNESTNLLSHPYTPKQEWEDSWLDDVDVIVDLDQP